MKNHQKSQKKVIINEKANETAVFKIQQQRKHSLNMEESKKMRRSMRKRLEANVGSFFVAVVAVVVYRCNIIALKTNLCNAMTVL